jgi:hypothetical protein
MSTPKVAIDIAANDKTAKGIAQAEKRFEGATKRMAKGADRGMGATQRGVTRWGRGITRTFGEVERATERAFSGPLGSGGAGVIGRLGAIRNMAGLAGGAMGEAAVGAGALEAGIAGVGGAALTAGAAVVGLAVGMVKLSDSWGKGATQLGNMASLIGVSAKGLQEFAGAAERVGVDKNTAMGALGGLSQTLNDARYGRNNGAVAILARMGVKMQLNKDGTADTEAMLPQIAEALSRQNSSGRRTAGRALGISDAALAAFTQGGAALSSDMKDFGKNGAVLTDDDVKLGRDITRRDTQAMQWMGKGLLAVQRANASVVKGAGDMAIDGYGSLTKGGGDSAPSAAPAPSAGGVGTPGASAPPSGYTKGWRRGGRFSAKKVDGMARAAYRHYLKYRAQGMPADDAAGWAAVGQAESSNDPHSQQPGGPGYGLFQWGSTKKKYDRRIDFQKAMGKSIYGSSAEDQERFRKWELGHTEKKAARLIDQARGSGGKAAAITEHYERPAKIARDSADRANIAERIVKLEIEFKNAPAGVKATAKAGGAISHAFSNSR